MKKSNMRSLFSFIIIALGGILLTACGGKKATPEEEVRNYGKYFVEKLAANQLDSLKAGYPDIVKADSIVPVQSDSIMVVESAPGEYDMTLAEGIMLKVSRSDDGTISVTESKGLFAFPADKIDIAKKTGMWDESLSDVQLNERMQDEEFFKSIEKRSKTNTNNLISVGKMVVTKDWPGFEMQSGSGYFPLKNNTDMPISGSDYQVVIKMENSYSGETWTTTESGKDLSPQGSARINVQFNPRNTPDKASIKYKVSESELKTKLTPDFTGDEYQKYIDSKK